MTEFLCGRCGRRMGMQVDAARFPQAVLLCGVCSANAFPPHKGVRGAN
jgi:hypothetical protein